MATLKAPAPKKFLKNGVLRNLATLVMALSDAAGSDSRNNAIADYITLIRNTRIKTFNALALWIHPSEIAEAPFFAQARTAGLEIVADTIQSALRIAPDYPKYIQNLYKIQKIRVFRVDDVETVTDKDTLKRLTEPILDLPNTKVILSGGMSKIQANTRTALNTQLPLELQLYRHKEDTMWVERWTKDYGMAVAALEYYKPPKGQMTTPEELNAMMKHLIKSDVENITCYGIDPTTWYLPKDEKERQAVIASPSKGEIWWPLAEHMNAWWESRLK